MEEQVEELEAKFETDFDESTASAKEQDERYDDPQPGRWWFASTSCPLLAGTFAPIASGFNVCALVYGWRVRIPRGDAVEQADKISDPVWLLVLNALSLAAALTGNAALLLSMARKVSFLIAQPVTISGFALGGAFLIAAMSALTSSPTYFVTPSTALADARLALTSAFYYAMIAAAIYMIVALLMCLTVYGAHAGHYERGFSLSAAQRTLMVQTMAFMAYLLLGALVFSKIEGWEYLEAVYWADVTLLTVGFGDFAPSTALGRALLFPYAVGGILTIGLVVGSIRTLVLDRGRENLAARLAEKRRVAAIRDVDERKQTIRISLLIRADFSTDPRLSPAQRRQEEFQIMRKVQACAERERRWFSLLISITFALLLWLGGAGVFVACEQDQNWSYFNALYFTFVSLVTVGYGDLSPRSSSGMALYVFWSLLAVPSLTILISNLGDTISKEVSDLTISLGSGALLHNEGGSLAVLRQSGLRAMRRGQQSLRAWTAPGIFGIASNGHTIAHAQREDSGKHRMRFMDRIAQRLEKHIEQEELRLAEDAEAHGDPLQRDIHFYHYVLSRECVRVQRDLRKSPPKQYSWLEWEYYLKLVGNEESTDSLSGHRLSIAPEVGQSHYLEEASSIEPGLLPNNRTTDAVMRLNTDGNVDRETELQELREGRIKRHGMGRHPEVDDLLSDWSWLSENSPLTSSKTESEWILERLSAALESDLNRQRKGQMKKPPISMRDAVRRDQAARTKGYGTLER